MAKVKVGVAWRRDGFGQAHLGDLGVFDHPWIKNEVDVYSLAWSGAQTGGGLRLGVLSDMDLLVIPGGPHANATQIPVSGQTPVNQAEGNTATYANARARSELDLIEQARTLGMPILALCGGSWRLMQIYGGSTVELAALDSNGRLLATGSNNAARLRHAGNMNNVDTEFKHPLSVTQGSLLDKAMGGAPNNMQANSVHWAVARTAAMGTRTGLAQQQFEVVPNNMLRVSATDPSALGTPEAVESSHGAPVLGVQWHPEYQLPVNNGQQPASRNANLALLQWMIKAGRAYRAHREAMAKLLGNASNLKTAQAVKFRGAPVHTGDPGVGPAATTIRRHADDTAPTNLAKAEQAVRSYLFNLGRKGKLFLTPTEVFNLASGAPLSRIRDADEMRKGPVVAFMNTNVWARKYCDQPAKDMILKWPE